MFNPCSLCDANCCKSYLITITSFDVLRIANATGKLPGDFATLHQARLLSFDPDNSIDIKDDNWSYLLGLKSHPCVFLGKDNLCTIHNSAPLSCRRYPFTLTSKMNARFCPLPSKLMFVVKGADISCEGLKNELTAHQSIVKEWNNKPGTKEECMVFLLERAKEKLLTRKDGKSGSS